MNWDDLALAVLFGVLVLLGALLLRSRRKRGGEDFPLRRVDALLPAERGALLADLEEALGEGYRVFCKVPLTALLEAADHVSDRQAEAALARVEGWSVDFLICRRDLSPVAVAEASANGEPGEGRGEAEEALFAAGLPVVRIPERGASPEEIEALLLPVLRAAALEEGENGDWSLGEVGPAAGEDWELGGGIDQPLRRKGRR